MAEFFRPCDELRISSFIYFRVWFSPRGQDPAFGVVRSKCAASYRKAPVLILAVQMNGDVWILLGQIVLFSGITDNVIQLE